MAYLQLGDIDASHFNTTKYPGTARPADTATLAVFKNMQAQFNRIAQAIGATKISVDGDIGAGTLSLLGKIAANLGQGGVSVDPARNILMQAAGYSAADVAAHADTLGNAAQGVADQMKVPGKISQPSSGSSLLVSATGVEGKVSTPTPASASLMDAFGNMDTTTMLVVAGGIGAAVYFSGKKKKGGPRKNPARRSTRRSRRHARRGSRR